MPKRSYPFGEAAPLQLKTRVGLRELCCGVRGHEYRREVFERTRRLLFKGAQAYMEGARLSGCQSPPPGPTRAPGETQEVGGASGGSAGCRWSEQLLIGHDGKLRRSPAAAERAPPAGVSKACSSCVRTADVKELCTQCDRSVCQSCSRLCSCCNAVTCALCSTTDYSDVGEQVLCNGCSMFEV
ncbi:SIVA protein, partial [Rhinopomastus cyanomelas]|nr:SIVA protein [Rhinopomastus cyanomelas]